MLIDAYSTLISLRKRRWCDLDSDQWPGSHLISSISESSKEWGHRQRAETQHEKTSRYRSVGAMIGSHPISILAVLWCNAISSSMQSHIFFCLLMQSELNPNSDAVLLFRININIEIEIEIAMCFGRCDQWAVPSNPWWKIKTKSDFQRVATWPILHWSHRAIRDPQQYRVELVIELN